MNTLQFQMRNKIFDNFNPRKLGMDIPSNDILVGRDQGLSPYHVYLEKFFGIKVTNWDDLLVTISKQVSTQRVLYTYCSQRDFNIQIFSLIFAEHQQTKNYL